MFLSQTANSCQTFPGKSYLVVTFLMVMWSLAESKPCGLLILGFHIWYDRCRCREGCTSRAITSDCRVSCMHISFFVFHEHLSSFWM
jgi:hypothetical protein